jgi:hypothetical protein
VILTYSYSNLLDGTFLLLSPDVLRVATEEALGLWASYTPLRFVEQVDAGPAPSAESYASGATPQIRIGHQAMAELAFGYFPGDDDGLAGDIHFDSDTPWALNGGPWNFLEALTHELGHALGLGHETERPGVMNPFHPRPFYGGLGSAYLTPADIEAIQARYGVGVGSVQSLESNPVPEPATVLCVGVGLVVLARRRLALRRVERSGQERRELKAEVSPRFLNS